MRWPAMWLLVVALLAGGIAPVAARGFSEVDSFVWIEGTVEEPDSPYVEAIVFVGTDGKTGWHHDQVNCNLYLIEHNPPKTKVSAFCEVGKKARGAKSYLAVWVRDGEKELVASCQSKTRELRQYSRFACSYEEPPAASATSADGELNADALLNTASDNRA